MITSLAMAPCPVGGGDELATVPSLSSRLAWAYSVVVTAGLLRIVREGKRQYISTFQASACIMLLVSYWPKQSHV